jgi:hypothetical protein
MTKTTTEGAASETAADEKSATQDADKKDEL